MRTTAFALPMLLAMTAVAVPQEKPKLDKTLLEVVRLTNVQRKKAGRSELLLNDKLCAAAQFQADDMQKQNYFAHQRSGGPDLGARVERTGYNFRTVGENIAMGQPTAAVVMNSWMNSPGHRANILNPDFREIGVAFTKDPKGRILWVQVFGASFN